MASVSVVMPVFNGAETIGLAVDSIRRQTFPDWELIIVDDGSTDDTRPLLEAYARAEPRLRLVTRPHSGIVEALNAGLAEARAPLVARMDADDVAEPERLAEQLSFLEQAPDIGLVGSLVRFGGDRQQAAGYALHVEWMNSVQTAEAISVQRFVESPFAHPSVTFRRELLVKHGRYAEGEFPEDYELWLRWLDRGVKMAKVPKVLLTWNDLPNRLSRSDQRYSSEAFYRCKAHYLARWLQREVGEDRPLFAWGAGRLTRRRLDLLVAEGVTLAGYIDIDPHKCGRKIGSLSVLSPARIPPPSRCFVIGYVAKRGARELARSHLIAAGFVEGQDFVMGA